MNGGSISGWGQLKDIFSETRRSALKRALYRTIEVLGAVPGARRKRLRGADRRVGMALVATN